MASSSPPFAAVFLLLLLPISSSALPSRSLLNAAEILADSGFLSMALTLEVTSSSLVPKTPSLTIFAPPDAAFARSGQPSLSLLQLHFAPVALPLQTLTSLPVNTKIPTLHPSTSLIVTSAGAGVSLDGVRVTTTTSAIYDDGFLIILGVQDFFNLKYQPQPPPSPQPTTSISGQICRSGLANGASWLQGARSKLRSNGYKAMASFLDLQLMAFKNSPAPLTVFAPVDLSLESPVLNASVYLRHVVPCRLTWSDLVDLSEGTTLPTYLDGFTITVSRSGDVLLLNGAPVYYPDMYSGETVVVHGLQEKISKPPEKKKETPARSSPAEEEDDGSSTGGGDESLDDEREF